MQLQSTHKAMKTLHTIIISNILILFLLTSSACSSAKDTDAIVSQDNSEQGITDDSQPSETVSEYDEDKDTLLPRDIEFCKEMLSKGGAVIEDEFEYDVDLDGRNELLIPFLGELKIYKKIDNRIIEKSAYGVHYVKGSDLHTMQAYSQNQEQYSYFYYKYEGTMQCYVLVSIKYNKESDDYTLTNELSWGICHSENTEQIRPFFRKSWNQSDVTASEDDISQEEFLEIYSKYENLPHRTNFCMLNNNQQNKQAPL